jgi:hypothetical protein
MSATEYRKLIVIVWIVVLASMAAIWGGNAWRGIGWDTDDFMRLVQVRDWLGGQGWSDLTQHRLNPPDGTPMHWSRLPDLPLAAVTLALSPFLSINDALTVAAMAVPPLCFLLFLVVYALPARMMLGMARSPIGLLVAISGSGAVAQYAPGRVDHHGLQLILILAAIALLLFGLARPRWRSFIAFAGLPIALSIWTGVEMLPLIAAWFAALGLVWCREGGALARQGAVAAALAALIGGALILAELPRTLWLAPACDAFSIMPVGAMALIAGGFGGMALLERWAKGAIPRLLVAGLCGGAAAAVFALAFPACVGGGYGGLDPEVRFRWLSHVGEALPLAEQWRFRPFGALDKVWTPLLALAYCLWRCARSGRRGQRLWGALALLIAAATALIFWQVRAATAAQIIALMPLAALIAEIWQRLRGRRAPRWRQFLVLLPTLLICSAVFWPALEYGYRYLTIPAAPGAATAPSGLPQQCTDRAALPALAEAPPTLILSYIDLGPMLLFSTPHAVLGAPYHRNNGGLLETIHLFRANDDAWIRDRLSELGVGWVVTCPGPEDRTAYATEGGDGLAERLAAGQVPDYLVEVPDPGHPGLKLFRVLP